MADIKITDNSPEVINAKDAAVIKFLTEAGLHLVSESQKELENDPRRIDTGTLRGSIDMEVDEAEPAVYVGTNIEYAVYV